MILTEKPKSIHVTFRDPAERRSKTTTLYGVTLEQAMERTVGKSDKSESSSAARRPSRPRKSA